MSAVGSYVIAEKTEIHFSDQATAESVFHEFAVFVVVVVVHDDTKIVPVQFLRQKHAEQTLGIDRKLIAALQGDLSLQFGGNRNQLLCLSHRVDLHAIYVLFNLVRVNLFCHFSFFLSAPIGSYRVSFPLLASFYTTNVSKV